MCYGLSGSVKAWSDGLEQEGILGRSIGRLMEMQAFLRSLAVGGNDVGHSLIGQLPMVHAHAS